MYCNYIVLQSSISVNCTNNQKTAAPLVQDCRLLCIKLLIPGGAHDLTGVYLRKLGNLGPGLDDAAGGHMHAAA